eukprot:05125_5
MLMKILFLKPLKNTYFARIPMICLRSKSTNRKSAWWATFSSTTHQSVQLSRKFALWITESRTPFPSTKRATICLPTPK